MKIGSAQLGFSNVFGILAVSVILHFSFCNLPFALFSPSPSCVHHRPFAIPHYLQTVQSSSFPTLNSEL